MEFILFMVCGLVFNHFVTPRLWDYLISGYEAEKANVRTFSTFASCIFPFMATFFAFVYMFYFKLKVSFAPVQKTVASAVQNPQPKEPNPPQSTTQPTRHEVKPAPVVDPVDKGFLFFYPDDENDQL